MFASKLPLTLALCFCSTPPTRLADCLENLHGQDYPALQILLVDDSNVLNKTTANIIQDFLDKDSRFCYVSHHANLGSLEARRTATEHATGDYLFWIDDDDLLSRPSVLSELAALAKEHDTDIVQGLYEAIDTGTKTAHKDAINSFVKDIQTGLYQAENLQDLMFTQVKTSAFVWGKLIRTSLVQRAFEEIPSFYCTMQEDMLISFFIAQFAQSYYGYNQCVYQYIMGQGISNSNHSISLEDFAKKHLTTAVYTIIFEWLSRNPNPSLEQAMQRFAFTSVKNTLKTIQHRISPADQERAYEILCENWSEAIVQKVEKAMGIDSKDL